jgi:hypothetical protein
MVSVDLLLLPVHAVLCKNGSAPCEQPNGNCRKHKNNTGGEKTVPHPTRLIHFHSLTILAR